MPRPAMAVGAWCQRGPLRGGRQLEQPEPGKPGQTTTRPRTG